MTHAWQPAEAAEFLARIAPIAAGRSIVWDFDGVVADTEPMHEASFRVLCEQRGWTLENEYFRAMVGNTEAWAWERMFADGFPVRGEPAEDLRELMAARREIFLEQAERSLPPSWISELLMPAFDGIVAEQAIVSNGDPSIIERLLRRWSLDSYVTVIRRVEGEDKRGLLEARLGGGSVLLEDDARWLAMGAAAGATTVAVRHGYSRDVDRVVGDFIAEL